MYNSARLNITVKHLVNGDCYIGFKVFLCHILQIGKRNRIEGIGEQVFHINKGSTRNSITQISLSISYMQGYYRRNTAKYSLNHVVRKGFIFYLRSRCKFVFLAGCAKEQNGGK